ncbi:helix-turn-helix transcriptional regulator [Cardiobacteriaceae bacterium TAE3-ERU3]|nr:helix-turn-helix transcriptional regulator [Cardiobacteriaceae bacterium TAE3-ERU3]
MSTEEYSKPSIERSNIMLSLILEQNQQRLSEQQRLALLHDGFSTHHLSTSALPKKERFDYWRSNLSSVYQGLQVEPLVQNQSGYVDVEIAFTKRIILGVGINDAANCTFTQTDDADADLFWLSFYFSLNSKAEAKLMRSHRAKDEVAIKVNHYDFMLYDSRYISALKNQAGSGAVLRIPICRHDFPHSTPECFADPYRMTNFIKQSSLYPFIQGRIRFLAEQRQTLDETCKKALLMQVETMLHHILLEANQALSGHKSTSDSEKSYAAQFSAAEQYMLNHISQPLRIHKLAKAVGCSTSQLYKIFAYYDTSPAKYATKLRLEYLLRLIKASPMESFSHMISRCGFDDLSQVGKIFRKTYGMTMSEWREQAIGS